MEYLISKAFDEETWNDTDALKTAFVGLAREIEAKHPAITVEVHDSFLLVTLPEDRHIELAAEIAMTFGCDVEPNGEVYLID